MLEQAKVVVTNTTPLIALTAATGGLEVLRAIICPDTKTKKCSHRDRQSRHCERSAAIHGPAAHR